MPNRRTRERQLAKLAQRRAAERRKKRRQRTLVASLAVLIALAGLSFGFVLIFRNTSPKTKPVAKASVTPTPTATPTLAGGVACGGTVPAASAVKKPTFTKAPKMSIKATKTYTATMVTSCGAVVMKLLPKESPNTVNSFVFLARHHFYDGLIFHRLSRDFVIQGGDPTGTGTGGPGYKTVDAPPKDAKYTVGVVAMAKSGAEPAGTSGSQFFIVTGSQGASLTPDYAIIGTVVSGQDVATKIDQLPIEGNASDGRPTRTIYIVKVTIKES